MQTNKIVAYLKTELQAVLMPLLPCVIPLSMQINGIVDFSQIPTSLTTLVTNLPLYAFGLFGILGSLMCLCRMVVCVVGCFKLLWAGSQIAEPTEIDKAYAIYLSEKTIKTKSNENVHLSSILMMFWLVVVLIFGLCVAIAALIANVPALQDWLFSLMFP